MIELVFVCDQSDLQFCGGPRVAEGCRDYVQARFELGRDWRTAGMDVYATFRPRSSMTSDGRYNDASPVDVSVDQRGTCYVPQACLVWPGFSVCLHGRSVKQDINSSICNVPVSRSIEGGCGITSPGVEDALKWANEALETAQEALAQASRVTDAMEHGAFDGDRGASFMAARTWPTNNELDASYVTAPDGKVYPYDLVVDPSGYVWMVRSVGSSEGGTASCPCGCGCQIPTQPGVDVLYLDGPLMCLAGPKGDKGDKGDPGEKGDKGDAGEKGEPGEDGRFDPESMSFRIDENGHLVFTYTLPDEVEG